MTNTSDWERKRQLIQVTLDQGKRQSERNSMGQFSTPLPLANDILHHAAKLIPNNIGIRFLDPAIGTGVFFSALNNAFQPSRIVAAQGFEIDRHYGEPSRELWADTILDYRLADFTEQSPPINNEDKFNLIICNPPYVRHHHINGQKTRLKEKALKIAGMHLSGLAGLYCYFMALSHEWMQEDGIAGWLIPSEFMDVNYGQVVKDYLLSNVTLLQIHRFDPTDLQFNDALVSSTVVWFRSSKQSHDNKVLFTFGGTIDKPVHEREVDIETLRHEKKWTRFPMLAPRQASEEPVLGDFFTIKRGIATGDNKFFVMTREEIQRRSFPLSQFRPILPSPRYLDQTEINADKDGMPFIKKQLFVLDSSLLPDEIERRFPKLYTYLLEGIKRGVPDRYLCKSRKVWYSQEVRPESRFYCTYIGRTNGQDKKPFRFILNHSKAIVSNSYLILYPKPIISNAIDIAPRCAGLVVDALNEITTNAMLEEGRVYGGGMHKIEPKELSRVSAGSLARLLYERKAA